MTRELILQYGPLRLFEGEHFFYITHWDCIRQLITIEKKNSPFYNANRAYSRLSSIDEHHRCCYCRQGISKKALDHLIRTAKLLV